MPKAESKSACLVVGAGDGTGGAIAKAFAADPPPSEAIGLASANVICVCGAKPGETLHLPETD